MDVREFKLWTQEARIRRLVRRSENYAASLLPHREAEKVNSELERLELAFYEADHEEEIEEAEKDMREYLAKLKKRGKR